MVYVNTRGESNTTANTLTYIFTRKYFLKCQHFENNNFMNKYLHFEMHSHSETKFRLFLEKGIEI